MGVSDDGFGAPTFARSSSPAKGQSLLMHYTGLVEQTERFSKAAEAD